MRLAILGPLTDAGVKLAVHPDDPGGGPEQWPAKAFAQGYTRAATQAARAD